MRYAEEVWGIVSTPHLEVGGVFTYLKIGLAVAVLAVCGYYVYNYHHMKAVIDRQQTQIANLEIVQGVLTKKQQAVDEYIQKSQTIKRRVQNEQRDLDAEVNTVDNSGLLKLYEHYRVRPGEVGSPSNGPASRPKYPPAR